VFVCLGEFEILSKPIGVPLVAFRLKKRTLSNGEMMLPPWAAFAVMTVTDTNITQYAVS
jgi:hypothetical protein